MSFRETPSQQVLFATRNLLPPEKQARLESDWPGRFAAHILPLIDESRFSHFYHATHGRPNKPVKMVVGVLLLKELQDLTDEQALAALAYDLRWQVALNLTPDAAWMCQKTLHNFRTAMAEDELAPELFHQITGALIEQLGIETSRQRIDSSQIASDIAKRNRMGLFCETIRKFLRNLRRHHRGKGMERVPSSLWARYLKEDGEGTRYEDVRRSELHRRLGVAARDVWRLLELFRDHPKVKRTQAYQLLERLYREQCEQVTEPVEPEEGDADSGEAAIPVTVKETKEIASDSLQTPHDPDATYSGHKGEGYELQAVETCANGPEPLKPELITAIWLSERSGCDSRSVIPALESLAERGHQPEELLGDTAYASTANVIEAEDLGTEVVGPVGPRARFAEEGEVTVGDFAIDLEDASRSACPQGHAPLEQSYEAESGRIEQVYEGGHCEGCALAEVCPTEREETTGHRKLETTRHKAKLESRKREQATERFKKRYADRSGIERTYSETKGPHGVGRLRVRGRARVQLAALMKMLACNVKRSLRYLVAKAAPPVCAEDVPQAATAAL
jgi:transposase